MKYFAKGVLLAMLAALTLTSCGGGGGSTGNATGVYIGASVSMSGPVYSGVAIVSTDTSGNNPITDATVTLNGAPLTYNSTYKFYINNIVTPVAGNFTLVVTANGATYTTTESIYTSVPVLTVPAPFTATAAHTISWTAPGGVPIGSSMSYFLEIANQTTHAVVYTQSFITSLSTSIPANTTQATTSYAVSLFGMRYGAQIANAMAGSSLDMFAFALPVNFNTP